MRPILLYIGIISMVLLLSCSNEEISDPYYPTTITEISSSEIEQIYENLWETSIYECTSVDAYGYCHIVLSNDGCGVYDSIYIDYTRDEISALFYDAVESYHTFLNIDDTTGIKIASIRNIKGAEFDKFNATYPDSATTGWIVTSNLQTLNGYLIPGTEIKVLILFDQVRSIEGKRYGELYVPETDVYTEEDAKNSLLNEELTYSSSTLDITSDIYWGESDKVVLPIAEAGKIELRICWKLRPESWVVMIDSQTGRLLTSVDMDEI